MKQVLDAILDTMLPGGEGFPNGAATDASDWLLVQDRFRPALEALIADLPSNFVDATEADRINALRAAETSSPVAFDAATIAIYSAYYTRSDVLAVIEAVRGYKAGPPQPGGYDLPGFDPEILAVPRTRSGLWRDPDEEIPR